MPGRSGLLFALAPILSLAACATTPPASLWRVPVVNPVDVSGRSEVEQLGYRMHQKDVAAWRATDSVRAVAGFGERGEVGWIVSPVDQDFNVRFVDGDERVPWDVLVDSHSDRPPLVIRNEVPEGLRPDELGMWRARRLAIDSPELQRCTPNVNTIVMPSRNEAGDWLVYLLASTTDPQAIPVGIHYRVRVDAEGSEILAIDALSKDCMVLNMDWDGVVEGVFFANLVAESVLETHVLLSLQVKPAVMVVVRSGRNWIVTDGVAVELERFPAPEEGGEP